MNFQTLENIKQRQWIFQTYKKSYYSYLESHKVQIMEQISDYIGCEVLSLEFLQNKQIRLEVLLKDGITEDEVLKRLTEWNIFNEGLFVPEVIFVGEMLVEE